jgi:hypothetical protein
LELDQSRLNIEVKSRTSRLPWKGQFSPNLIEYFMEMVCPESKSFLDPFCGSGTVLFEAVERGCSAVGTEVNPAAWHLANLASFSGLPAQEKTTILRKLKELASSYSFAAPNMFQSEAKDESILDVIEREDHPFIRNALASAVLLGMGDKAEFMPADTARGAFSLIALLTSINPFTAPTAALLNDSRSLPLQDSTLDAMITSPPYINVFNYHQNYRPAAELLGWNPLEAARSEIGSNRKHRMNRFLTVIQYAMDMAMSLNEANRVLVEGAPQIVVIGRTSNVLGTSFENSSILFEIMQTTANRNIQTAERVFTNRFGERIYEDILISHKAGRAVIDLADAKNIGCKFLENARSRVPEKNRVALEDAIAEADKVHPSALLQLSIPNLFAGNNRE